MKDKVLAIVKKEGAVLPVQVASKLGIDSLLASAYLTELVENGLLKRTTQRLGTSYIFYLPNHEKKAKEIFERASKQIKTVKIYASGERRVTPELLKKQQEIIRMVQRVEAQKQKPSPSQPQKSSVPLAQPSAIKQPEFRQPHPIPSKTEVEHKVFEPVKENFLDRAMDFLRSTNCEILEEVSRKKKEVELIVAAPSHFGKMRVFVKVKDKKTISESDLSLVHSKALSRGLQAVLITNGKLSKSAKDFLGDGGKVLVKVL